MFETLKTIGAFVGLATGIFTIYDRLWRYRPVVSLSVEPGTAYRFVVVSNPSPHQHIAVIGFSSFPKIYAVAKKAGIDATIDAVADKTFQIMIKPNDSMAFPLHPRATDGRQADLDKTIALVCVWWRKGKSLWLWQFPNILFISPTRLQAIVDSGLE